MSLAFQLRFVGVGLIALALLHAAFPRRFNWKEELPRLSLLNRQIMVVHSFFIGVTLAFFGMLSLVIARELAAPNLLSKAVLAGFVAFWSLRLVTQLFVYDSRLWCGDRFNTVVHVVFIFLWSYLVLVYGVALWLQLHGAR